MLTFLLFISLVSHSVTEKQPFGLEERLGEVLPADVILTDENSTQVQFGDIISKPTLLTFVYYRCDVLCPKTLEGIAELVNYTGAVPGHDYNIVTVSINHDETPEEAKKAKNQYVNLIRKSISENFWKFYVADSNAIRKLTGAAGWEFRKDGDNFVHTTSSLLVTPDGKISQYFYGTYFNYMHFAMSAEIAEREEVLPTRLKNLKYCYNYKPVNNRKVVIITTIFGVSMILIVIVFFIILNFRKV